MLLATTETEETVFLLGDMFQWSAYFISLCEIQNMIWYKQVNFLAREGMGKHNYQLLFKVKELCVMPEAII